jgi:hypothetical protein
LCQSLHKPIKKPFSMGRIHKMTPFLNNRLAQAMDHVLAHPIAAFFLSSHPARHFKQCDQLSQICESVLIGHSETLEEWRRDIHQLRQSTTSLLAANAASELQRLFDREYRKLTIYSSPDWGKRVTEAHQKLSRVLRDAPPHIALLGSVGLLLEELGRRAVSAPPERVEGHRISMAPDAPLDPEWHGADASCGDDAFLSDEEECFVHYRTFVDFSIECEPVSVPGPDEVIAVTPDPSHFESPPVRGKTPRQVARTGSKCPSAKPSARIQLSVPARSAKPPTSPALPADSESDQEEANKKRRRGRPPREKGRTQEDGAPTDREIRGFMVASQMLTGKEELMDICTIILQNEPGINPDDPIVDGNLEVFKLETVRALVNYAKKTLRRQGKQYPEF